MMSSSKAQHDALAALRACVQMKASKHEPINSSSLPQKTIPQLSRTDAQSRGSTNDEIPRSALNTAFAESVFILLFIQPDDEIFELTFRKLVSRGVQDQLNNGNLDYDEFHDILRELRATLSDRHVISQTVLGAPPDATGLTTTVGHTASFTGFLKNGSELQLNIIAVGTVVIGTDGSTKLIQEKLVISTDSVGS